MEPIKMEYTWVFQPSGDVLHDTSDETMQAIGAAMRGYLDRLITSAYGIPARMCDPSMVVIEGQIVQPRPTPPQLPAPEAP